MGLLDKAKAAAAEAKQQALKAKDSVDERFADNATYKSAQSGTQRVGERAKDGVRSVSDKTEQALSNVGETTGGQRVGGVVRKVGKTLGELPLLSAAADTLRMKNCVDLLVNLYREDPSDPERNLWLAEALARTKRDMKTYRALRGAIDPSSFVISAVAQQAATLGDDKPELQDRLLRRAWSGAASGLQCELHNAQSLHVLARIYLATGYPASALKVAKRAAVVSPTDGTIFVTMAHAYRQVGQNRSAKRAAELAVERGCTLGYEVIAEIELAIAVESASGTARSRVEAFEETIQRVSARDKVRYAGAARRPEEVASALKSIQVDKARNSFGRAKQLVNRGSSDV